MTVNRLANDVFQDLRVLIVDDEEVLSWSIENELKSLGAEVMRAASLSQALDRCPKFNPDVAISDLRLPDGNGLELLKKWRKEIPSMPVILITAHGAVDSAVTALRLGAFDYLQKPFDLKDLTAAVHRACEVASLRQKVSRLEGAVKTSDPVQIIGRSSAMMTLTQQLRRVASSHADTVLICGDTGTGKELAARAIHEWSDRAREPYMEINCASIPENLLESELFGYEKGAFTDARSRKLGLFEMARGGTIFLDEIGELPLKLQSKLLRALEYRRFKRLGGVRDIEFTARIVAATNRDLASEVNEKTFRIDLFYRLNMLSLHIPALRERLEDVPELAEFFLTKLANELQVPRPTLSLGAKQVLMQHSWPGNVRELRNVLMRAMVLEQPTEIEPRHLRLDLLPTQTAGVSTHGILASLPTVVEAPQTLPRTPVLGAGMVLPESGISLETLEKSLLTQALERAHNNQSRAAQLLDISRHTLRYRMEKHGLLAAHESGTS